MKSKLFLEFFAIAFAFFAVWFALSHINFVSEDDLKKFSKASERKLAELILETLENRHSDFDERKIKTYIDSIGSRICESNNIPFDSIKIHIIYNSEVNAFALPDRNMVIYTGLVENAKNAEEVAGVMAHEIGHMEKDHVMKKLAKEIGISILFVIAGGNENLEVLKEAGRTLSSTAFDRSQEREADAFAVDALAKAEIDTQPFGNFLFRLSTTKGDIPEELVWISTHPDSKDRAVEVFKRKGEFTYAPKPIIKTPWSSVIELIKKDEQGD
jgi:beta-barrel assembly-enhancing protease